MAVLMIVKEGSIKLKVKETKKISKQMGVFYNPAMSMNRDISILLLNSINKLNLQIADPLAASGVRSIRFLKELGKNKIKNISINDINKNAIKSIRQNLALNKIQYKNNKLIAISNKDANLFLLETKGLDYIDIDPFGSPNFLLNSAIARLARGGILAVTATDTSALCGTFPNACIRKYWAMPKKNYLMHETGLRILIRKAQLVAAQYGKALTPVFSYSREHYMRVFFRNDNGKNKTDKILSLHGMFHGTGPMWLGSLWDGQLCDKMCNNSIKSKTLNKNKELVKFLKTIRGESRVNAAGFYDLSIIAEKNRIRELPKINILREKIRKFGYRASQTHFSGNGIRSCIPANELVNLLKKQINLNR